MRQQLGGEDVQQRAGLGVEDLGSPGAIGGVDPLLARGDKLHDSGALQSCLPVLASQQNMPPSRLTT